MRANEIDCRLKKTLRGLLGNCIALSFESESLGGNGKRRRSYGNGPYP